MIVMANATNLRKIFAIVLCVIMTLSMLSVSLAATDNEDENTPNTPVFPTITTSYSVQMANPSLESGVVNAGDTFYIGFTLLSNARYYYNDVPANTFWDYSARTTVSVSGTGFTLAGSLAEQELHAGYNSVAILSDESLETGRYQLTLTVTCEPANGTPVSDTRTFNVDIENSSITLDESGDLPKFVLSGASIPQGKGSSKLSTTLDINLKNPTNFRASDVEVTLSKLGDLVLNTYTDTVSIGDVAGGETVKASFPIIFPEFPTAQSTVTVTVKYKDAAGNESTQSYNVFIQSDVNESEASSGAFLTPKVIVSNYTTDVENIVSGEEFELTFVLKNTSPDKDLLNMTVKVNLNSSTTETRSEAVFSPIDGTTSFYTAKLDKNGELEYSIKLKTSASAGAKTYPIEISYEFQYEDGKGGYTSSDLENIEINLPVTQPIKFELMEWYPPTECYGADGCTISFQYFNKSKNPMTNLAVSVEGDFSMPTQYVGTLAASSYDFFSGTIIPNDPSAVGETKTAILVFTFEDASSNEQRVEYPFDVLICESMATDPGMGGDVIGGDGMGGDIAVDPGMPGMGEEIPAEGGMPNWAKYLLYVGVPVIAVAVIIVVVIVVKKRKAAKVLEDDDDE